MSEAKNDVVSIHPIVMLPLPDGIPRMESGPVQFADDWPGVFVRGDIALHMAMLMKTAAQSLRVSIDDQVSAYQLEAYANLIASCKAT